MALDKFEKYYTSENILEPAVKVCIWGDAPEQAVKDVPQQIACLPKQRHYIKKLRALAQAISPIARRDDNAEYIISSAEFDYRRIKRSIRICKTVLHHPASQSFLKQVRHLGLATDVAMQNVASCYKERVLSGSLSALKHDRNMCDDLIKHAPNALWEKRMRYIRDVSIYLALSDVKGLSKQLHQNPWIQSILSQAHDVQNITKDNALIKK